MTYAGSIEFQPKAPHDAAIKKAETKCTSFGGTVGKPSRMNFLNVQADLKPLEDVRYCIGKVIPLEELPVQTEQKKQSVLGQITEIKKEQPQEQSVQTDAPKRKKNNNLE